jgi:glycosyltransferase involved in cell wall biosynthesis
VTLEALQAQTVLPEQVIVVDDGSEDGTAAVAKQLGVRVIQQDHQGPGAARNRGIEAADTEFVAFCDADDWYVPDKLERAIDMLEKLGASCAASDAWVVRDDRVQGRKNEQLVVPSVLTLELLLCSNPIICSSVVARRQAIINAGMFDESPDLIATEDYDLWLRMASNEPIAYMSQPMTFYRVHAGSLSANTRFLRGIEHIMLRITEQHQGEAHFQNLIKHRRASVRLDLAWDLMSNGDYAQARQLINEAQQFAPTWKGFRMKLRSLLKR